MNPSQTMLLLTHAPPLSRRSDYEDWLREVANPFVTGIPEVVHFSNWRVLEAKLGSVPYTHFDYLFVASPQAARRIWSNRVLQDFIQEWIADWGLVADPQAESAPLRAFICKEVAPPRDSQRSKYVVFLPHSLRPDALERGFEGWLRDVDSPFINSLPEVVNYSGWTVVEATLGTADFTNFDLTYVPGSDGFERLYGNPSMLAHEHKWIELWGLQPDQDLADNFPVVVAERVASSDAATGRASHGPTQE